MWRRSDSPSTRRIPAHESADCGPTVKSVLTFLGLEPRGLESVSYSSRVVDEGALARASNDEPFAGEAVAVLEDLLQSVRLVVTVRRVDDAGQPRTLSRDEAILAGFVVRLSKLHQGLLQCSSPPRMEFFGYLLRGATETAVNLRFLVAEGGAEDYEAFVHDSLRLDKQLYERVQAKVRERGGTVMPMEYGMLGGIERVFREAGVELDAVASKRRSGWTPGGAFGRFRALGLEELYGPYYGVQSVHAHGAWHELYDFHLSRQPDGGFLPSPDFAGELQVQAVLVAVDVLTGASVLYLQDAGPPCDDRDVLEDRLGFCGEKGRVIMEHYRRFRGMPSLPGE